MPNKATLDKVYDNLDFTYAFRAFMDNMRGVSIHALRKGMQDIGMKENEVLVFSELMDAKSLFLTAPMRTRSTSWGFSISLKGLWCWRPRRSSWVLSRTPGFAG